MLNISFIRENIDEAKKLIEKKGVDSTLVDDFLHLDSRWRDVISRVEALRARQNEISDDIKRSPDLREQLISEGKKIKESMRELELELHTHERGRRRALLLLPNVPFPDVPTGKDESENVVLREEGTKPKFKFDPREYLSVVSEEDGIDIARAAKVSGSRFGYLKGEVARLEIALISFGFRIIGDEGFMPVIPPVMIRPEPFEGMGRLTEADKDERYYLEKDNLYLVGSSEHTIGPMHMDEVFKADDLPRRYVAFSSCFRREAGSYGKDTKGILRVHQFDKVEMFSFVRPEHSEEEHKRLLSIQEKIMTSLKLPYRVVEICTGDMGFVDARQYDIETWLPGQGKYRETHSCSNTTDFQARGVNVRYKESGGDTKYVHMLNATGLAIGRMAIAIIENYQRADGGFDVPEALKKFMP